MLKPSTLLLGAEHDGTGNCASRIADLRRYRTTKARIEDEFWSSHEHRVRSREDTLRLLSVPGLGCRMPPWNNAESVLRTEELAWPALF